MKNTILTLASVAALAGAANAQTVNLLTNGSFETNNYIETMTGYGSSNTLPGWSTSASSGLFGVITTFGAGPSDGIYYIELADGSGDLTDPANISQTISAAAGTYNLTFSLGQANGVGVNVGDYTGSHSVATNAWETQDVTFNHGGGALTLSFIADGVNNHGFVDNVSITAVPEPSSTALLGLGGLALILRRKK